MQIGDVHSELMHILIGVAQGSADHFFTLMIIICREMSLELKLHVWFDVNKLSINVQKT